MKTIYTLLLLFVGTLGYSQNWSLINQNRTIFFQHSDSTHITNTIVVDSSEINGSNTTYFTGYAFKYCDTCFYSPNNFRVIYRYAKELLGFSIEDDVTNNQFNLDGNVVKQNSQVNDSWAFSIGITATTISKTEALILGVLDSIKTIHLTNNDTIIISKNYGVIRYPDFGNTGKYYDMVGYHEGQNSYGEYLPNFWRTYDFNVGDVFCFNNSSWVVDDNTIHKVKITILEKLSQNDTIKYVVKKLSLNEEHYGMSDPEFATHSYSTSNFTETIAIIADDNFIENCYGVTQQTAEPNYSPIYSSTPIGFYGLLFEPNIPIYGSLPYINFPISEIVINDSLGLGKNIKLYEIYTDSLLRFSMSIPAEDEFYTNYGRTIQKFFDFEYSNEEILVGSIVNGDTIGTIYNFPDDLGFEERTAKKQLNIYPNPATNQITIEANINNLKIYSNLGQLVMEIKQPNQVVDISQLSKGLYYVVANDFENNIFTSKLLIK